MGPPPNAGAILRLAPSELANCNMVGGAERHTRRAGCRSRGRIAIELARLSPGGGEAGYK